MTGSTAVAGKTETSSAPSPSAAADLTAPQTSTDGVEVVTYGTAAVTTGMKSGASPVYQAVHGVSRTPDRTVVYWSIGWFEEPEPRLFFAFGRNPFPRSVYDTYGSAPFVNIVLPGQGQFLYAVPDPGSTRPLRAATSNLDALPTTADVMGVMYTVLPPLPQGVDTVDVTLGYADVVTAVPVTDGLLEPTVEGPVVPLGTGWPKVPDALLTPVEALPFSVRPLFSPSEDIDGFSREAEAGEQVSIDLAADVLFAFDSADLSADALTRLDELAVELQARAAPGELSIVGHTDDNGPDDYNQDLSQRRAQAVADALAPALTGTDLQPVVEGRGETEPVADNTTEEGQQLNRRVTVSFTDNEEG